jgi:hypothetical protein
MLDLIAGGFIGWVCGKLGDSTLKHLAGNTELRRELDKAVATWAKALPKNRYVDPAALFPEINPSTVESERPVYCALQAEPLRNELPPVERWLALFLESWHWVVKHVRGPQRFFELDEAEASNELHGLA